MNPALVKAGVDAAITAGKIGASANQNKTEKKTELQIGDSDVSTADFNRRDLEKDPEQDNSQPTLGKMEDTPNPQEITDISEKDFTTDEEHELEKPEIKDTTQSFDSTPNDISNSSEAAIDKVDEVANIVSSGIDSNHTADTSAYSSGGINGTSAVGSSDTGNYEPLQLPAIPAGAFSKMMEPNSPETKSMLEQAEDAYSNDKDIDAKELPFTENEQTAEDVEDVVEADIPEETKEEILEKTTEDDNKIDEGEILEKAAEIAMENTPEEEQGSIKDTLKDIWQKGQPLTEALFYLFNPKSTSNGESFSMGNSDVDIADMKDADISTEGEADSFTSSTGSAPTAGTASGYSGSKINSDTSSGNVDSKIASSTGKGSIENQTTNGSASSAASSGSIRAAFDKILANGIDSGTSSGESKFEDSGISGGSVGSVAEKQENEPLKIVQQSQQQPQMPSIINDIHKEVSDNWEKWPERDGIHYKDKGSIAVLTENGSDIFVKFGTNKVKPLETIDSNRLEYVAEIL
jgi:hypothetical protein